MCLYVSLRYHVCIGRNVTCFNFMQIGQLYFTGVTVKYPDEGRKSDRNM
jgi:hypothetical protein